MVETTEVLEMIKKGESVYVEFKEEAVKVNDLAGEIVAFANSEGGTLLIGVSDNGDIKGIAESKFEEKIMNICRNNCLPSIIPLYEEISVEGKIIAVVTIPKGNNKPYYTVNNKYYIRVGTTKRQASREELMRLFEASGAIHFDISPVYNTSIKNLDLDTIRDYFFEYNTFDLYEEDKDTVERILINADILNENPQGNNCTVGGLLVFGRRVEDLLPQSGISFAHFNGLGVSEDLIDKKQITGTLPSLVEQGMLVIKNNIKTPSIIEGAKRIEKETYPSVVLREAIVNSLVHRNYSIAGSKIRIFMFDDRIEFHSPGKLPNTITIDKMKIGISYARNPFLLKYMENLRYIDRLGRGVPMIINKMKKAGAKEPLLKEMGEEFILTIFKPISF